MDFVSKRYGKLPSETLESGSTVDIQVALIGQQYENYVTKRAQRIAKGEETDHNLSQDALQAMVDRVKNNDVKKAD